MWYAGIDWADEHHVVVVLDERRQQVATKQVAHTVEGLAQLVSFLRGIVGTPERQEELACIIETSHGLLIAALLEAGLPVYPVNPKTVDRHRRPAGAKTDAIDAYLLARTGRSDFADLRRLRPDSALIHELKMLTRDQESLIVSQTRLVNQLTACLKTYYPVALTLFSKLQQPSTLAFLQAYPTPQAAAQVSLEDLLLLLKQTKHRRMACVGQRMWEQLRQPSLQADAITTRAKSRLMLALVQQLRLLLDQLAAYDKEIARLFQAHADQPIFSGLPGAGKRLAPRLLAEWGDDRSRYASAGSVQALGGTSPVPFESGKYTSVQQRHACIKPLRNALFQFAWQSTFQEPWAEAYYQRKRQEGKTHSMAVRALSNVWVRIIYALWRKHEPYQAATFLAAQQAHGCLAA
jgi:transposase